jgi:hypothetical protein
VGFFVQPRRLALVYENNPAFTFYTLTKNRAQTIKESGLARDDDATTAPGFRPETIP